jgi:Glycosyl transferase family 2
MADSPRVTLGVTTFNTERYLPGAFDELLAQDFQDFELVVCDNQSTDATWEICETYASKDARVRVYRNEENIGLSRNFARVVGLARGEYFRLTAHDDRIAPTLLSRCVAALDADPRAVLAYPRGIVIDDDGHEMFACVDEPEVRGSSAASRVARSMATLTYCNSVFGLIRTDVLRRTRLLSPLCAGDHPLLIELAARGEFHLVPEPLFFRRSEPGGSQPGFSGAGMQERREWLEPQLAASSRKPRAKAKPRNEMPRVAIETVKALMHNELPLGTRLAATATFGLAFSIRLGRIRLGAWHAKLARRRGAGS